MDIVERKPHSDGDAAWSMQAVTRPSVVTSVTQFYGNMAMKTTLELPDALMRAIKVQAAATDRRIKDVLAEAIARGLAASLDPSEAKAAANPGQRGAERAGSGVSEAALQAIFDAGDDMVRRGVDIEAWARHSRDVWR